MDALIVTPPLEIVSLVFQCKTKDYLTIHEKRIWIIKILFHLISRIYNSNTNISDSFILFSACVAEMMLVGSHPPNDYNFRGVVRRTVPAPQQGAGLTVLAACEITWPNLLYSPVDWNKEKTASSD